ncbi:MULTISPECIES: TorD/DmsD family molecular chaperone [Halomonas]|uniref:Molecular chaperone TorD family protein n=1 Tax=Halomonas binhaiensis TaxID=2562282 RepID=A0A5C1NFV0_9GAMM|nr:MULTISPECIES: molecular chaperone TorD family protein [Halomonas]QEM81740.1 molecular chaperone TorD family protein [Halomonas binhaiensis]
MYNDVQHHHIDDHGVSDSELRAEVYALLGTLLRQPPTEALRRWLAELEPDPSPTPSEEALCHAWQALAAAAAESDAEHLERAHFRHLVGVIQGDVLPYASWYRNGQLMDIALVDLRKDLRQLGIQRNTDQHDPEDHLGALFEVMVMLLQDEAVAMTAVSSTHAATSETSACDAISRHAVQHHAADFFQRHIAPWASRCLHDLSQVDTAFYSALGSLGQAFMTLENERYNDLVNRYAEAGQPLRIVTPTATINDMRRER